MWYQPLFLSLIKVLIRRRPLLYVVGLLIPSIFLMLVDVISFYLPLNSGTRIAFKISILLGYTVFRVNLTDEMPSTAVRTPLIGILFFQYIHCLPFSQFYFVVYTLLSFFNFAVRLCYFFSVTLILSVWCISTKLNSMDNLFNLHSDSLFCYCNQKGYCSHKTNFKMQ